MPIDCPTCSAPAGAHMPDCPRGEPATPITRTPEQIGGDLMACAWRAAMAYRTWREGTAKDAPRRMIRDARRQWREACREWKRLVAEANARKEIIP